MLLKPENHLPDDSELESFFSEILDLFWLYTALCIKMVLGSKRMDPCGKTGDIRFGDKRKCGN
jgi:hypothetical protein